MSTVPKINRIVIEDNIQKCFCSIEKIYKPCVEFSPRRENGILGYQYYCRKCCSKLSSGELETRVPIYVREGANELLTKIGYEIDSNLSVYQQFKEKHNLL
jgi:hypothetical protein